MKAKIDKYKAAEFLLYLTRIVIGCIFIYSSLPKLSHPYDFLFSVYGYELFGPKTGMFVAMTLPWLEILVGICLVGGIFISGALSASVGMAATFTFVLGSALHHHLDVTCGCFGLSSTELIGVSTLIRATLILLVSLLAYLWVIFRPNKERL